MIDPRIPITHLDPEGVRRLMAVIGSRQSGAASQLTVLHDAGTVVGVVHSVAGPLDGHRDAFDDPAARAEELLADTDAGRVVMLDRSGLDDLSAAVVEEARRLPSQGDLLLEAHRLYWTHPAVVTAPAPPRSSWEPVRDLLKVLPDCWIRIVLGPGETGTLDANLRLADGWLAEITGRPSTEPTMTIELTWADVEQIALANEPLRSLMDHLDAAPSE